MGFDDVASIFLERFFMFVVMYGAWIDDSTMFK